MASPAPPPSHQPLRSTHPPRVPSSMGTEMNRLDRLGNTQPGPSLPNGSQSPTQTPTRSPERDQAVKAEALVLAFWLLGVGVACAHHLLYWALNGKPVGTEASQRVVVGTGIVLAMFVAFCFGVVASHALTQQIWSSVRWRRWKVSSINTLFQAETTLRWVFNRDILRHARLVSATALFIWLLRLLTIAPPTTLSIAPAGAYTPESALCNYSSLNFQPLPKENRWPAIVYIDGLRGSALRLTSQLERILTGSAHAWDVSLPPSPCGNNCSHTVSFHGPAYDCENTPFSTTPWRSDDILRASSARRVIYISHVVNGTMWLAGSHLRPGIRNESAIFDGPDRRVDRPSRVTDDDFLFQAVQCRDWNASYEVTLSYKGSGSAVTVDRRTLLDPIDYVHDKPNVYTETNKAIHWLLARWLTGNVTLGLERTGNRAFIPPSLLVYNTKLVNTAVPYGDDEGEYFYVAANLRQAVEELHQNMTLSLLSASPNYHFVAPLVNQTCTVIKSIGLYNYDHQWLVGLYSVAAGITLIVFFLGFWTLRANGGVYDNSFATIVATTRNGEFDEYAKACTSGKRPLAPQLLNEEVRFGIVGNPAPNGTSLFAFGRAAQAISTTNAPAYMPGQRVANGP